jgi:hypothetical protein
MTSRSLPFATSEARPLAERASRVARASDKKDERTSSVP